MAEIRKFTQGRGGEIAQALAKAMGEGVRPATPGDGGTPTPRATAPASAPASGPTVTSGVIWDPFLKTTPAKALRKPATAPEQDAD